MGVETKAILSGHFKPDRVVDLLRNEVTGKIVVRDMQRPEYKVIEFQKMDGSWSALNLFLDSWAADDYADTFKGPSTLMTAEFTPYNFNLVRSITAAIGGLVRKTEGEPWVELEPART